MKIGIFGGSFNPPHNMHKNIALELIRLKFVDKVIFVPTGNRYNKDDLVDASYRFDMLNIICDNLATLQVSDFEIKNKLVSTYQTLDYFKKLYPTDEIFFIVGADNLAELDTWKRYEYLLENYKFLVIKRAGENIEELLKKYQYSNNIIVTNVAMNDVSSSVIRKMIKMKDAKIYEIMDENVINYLLQRNLYIN